MKITECRRIQQAWRKYKHRKKTMSSIFENLYDEYLAAERYYLLTDDEVIGGPWLYTRIDIFNRFAEKFNLIRIDGSTSLILTPD